MSKISKKLRAEAIELAGIRATFWQDETHASVPGDAYFDREVNDLVDDAENAAANGSAIYGRNDLGRWSENDWCARLSAEAQAMLLEGWSPS